MLISTRRYVVGRAIGIVVAAAVGGGGAGWGAEPVAVTAKTLTDAQVLGAIRKGAKYLLCTKGADRWESMGFGPTDPKYAGETALVLYALLHVGEGLQDDEELGPKLKFSSPELAPVIKFLAKVEPPGTYVAGLQASALGLVNKNTDIGREAGEGLNHAKHYIMESIGGCGGYDYTPYARVVTAKQEFVTFDDAWTGYVDARLRGDAANAAEAKQMLGKLATILSANFMGVAGRLQMTAAEITARAASAKVRKDAAAMKRAEAEAKELEAIAPELLKLKNPNFYDFSRPVAEAAKRIEDAQKALQTGGFKLVPATDGAGKPIPDGKGGVMQKKVPKTLADLKADLELARSDWQTADKNMKNKFVAWGDLSNGQYGTLGAWALLDAGVELPNGYWAIADRFWRLTQGPDGGWSYYPGRPAQPTPSMTVAGLASLFITSDQVETGVRLESKADPEIDRGLGWLNSHFTVDAGVYYLYGLERTGLASGYKFFGGKNWYREGAARLVNGQADTGNWANDFMLNQNVTTAYALLFLARGRNPVVFNKLQYDGPWNARPRDNANITAWMSKKFERPINWQIVNFDADVEEWQDAPVLLITGSRALKLSAAQIAKLKAYVEAGGIIFSSNDGEKTEFTESVKKIAGQLVLENGHAKYEMRELKKDHVLFSQELWGQIENPPRIMAMSNGVREIWVHSVADMGTSWQGRRVATREHFEFAANLNRYASGKASLRSKLEPLAVAGVAEAGGKSLAVARIDYAGNCDPEPGAWPRMAKVFGAQAKTSLVLKSVGLEQLNAKDTPVAHLTGTTQIPTTPADVLALRQYLADGGTLFIDAAGGSPAFVASAMNLIGDVAPGAVLAPIPATSRVHNGTIAGASDTTRVGYRRYYRLKANNTTSPQLQGVMSNGRYTVFFSAEDITSGLLGTNTWGILGYSPESAQALTSNILLYAMDPKAGWEGLPGTPAPATGPATSTGPATGPATAPASATAPATAAGEK